MTEIQTQNNLKSSTLNALQCPRTNEKLKIEQNKLVTESGRKFYDISENGIPLFADEFITDDARKQQVHYDRVWEQYAENLTYPHTIEYMKYLDDALFKATKDADLTLIAEICCGQGDALEMYKSSYKQGIGIDISVNMLNLAQKTCDISKTTLIQGDATRIPMADNTVTSVFMLGGIHHVNDREKLFCEIQRILKPGGKFYWREPVSDMFLWRLLRAIIYKLSPALDETTERPLRFCETEPYLRKVNLTLKCWETYGYIGFCFFMNSDILVFNRLFKYIPGIKQITRFFVFIDDLIRKLPFMKKKGLQVIGVAVKE